MESFTNFNVIGKIKAVTPDSKTTMYVEFFDAIVAKEDEKHVIKTFSDSTLIDEINRRYNVDLVINKIKE